MSPNEGIITWFSEYYAWRGDHLNGFQLKQKERSINDSPTSKNTHVDEASEKGDV